MLNVVYVLIITASTAILIAGGRWGIDLITIYTFAAFYAPIFSYLIVSRKNIKNLEIYIKLHALILIMLAGVYVYNLHDLGLDQGIGYFMIFVNVASFISSIYQKRILIE